MPILFIPTLSISSLKSILYQVLSIHILVLIFTQLINLRQFRWRWSILLFIFRIWYPFLLTYFLLFLFYGYPTDEHRLLFLSNKQNFLFKIFKFFATILYKKGLVIIIQFTLLHSNIIIKSNKIIKSLNFLFLLSKLSNYQTNKKIIRIYNYFV
jgi:hypothetical protein